MDANEEKVMELTKAAKELSKPVCLDELVNKIDGYKDLYLLRCKDKKFLKNHPCTIVISEIENAFSETTIEEREKLLRVMRSNEIANGKFAEAENFLANLVLSAGAWIISAITLMFSLFGEMENMQIEKSIAGVIIVGLLAANLIVTISSRRSVVKRSRQAAFYSLVCDVVENKCR